MIFQPSSSIDSRLAEAVTEIESQEIGLRVVSARIYKLPFFRVSAKIFVQSPRRFNILEEFVLRAGDDLVPSPTRQEVASLLGTDRLFIDATCQNLERLKVLEADGQNKVVLTTLGKQYYAQGCLPNPPEQKLVHLVYWVVTDKITAGKSPSECDDSDPILPGLNVQAEQQPEIREDFPSGLRGETPDSSLAQQSPESRAIASATTLQRVIDATTAAGLSLHLPSEGRSIIKVNDAVIEEQGFYNCGVFVVQDTICLGERTDNVSVRVINIQTNQQDIALEQMLDKWLQQERIKLADLLPPEMEILTPTPFQEETLEIEKPGHTRLVQELYQEQTVAARQQVQPEPPVLQQIPAASLGTIELLRDEAIRPRFLEILNQATQVILIVSPWMTEQVVDEDFRRRLKDLAQRRVLVLLGWGIARHQSLEERAPSQALLDSIQSINTPDGVPAVAVWWLGNQHSKDILVDWSIHMTGSHNWLSYRGDRLPRGESTYYVTVPGPVQSALEYIEPLFADAANASWNSISQHNAESKNELKRCCATWVAVRKPDEGINRILNLAKSDSLAVPTTFELMKVICLALAHLPYAELARERILDSMGLAIPDLVGCAQSANCPSEPLREFSLGFKQLLQVYAKNDLQTLVSFLQDQRNVWERIGLIQPRQQETDAAGKLTAERGPGGQEMTILDVVKEFLDETKGSSPPNTTGVKKKKKKEK